MNENPYVNFGSFIAATIVKCLMKTKGQSEETVAYVLGVNVNELKIKEGQIDYDPCCKVLNFLDDDFYKERGQWLSCLNSCLNLVNQKEQQLQRLLEYSEEFIQKVQAKDITIKNIIDFFKQSHSHITKQYDEKFIFDIHRKNSEDENELNLDVAYIYICILYTISKCRASTIDINLEAFNL
ncbi:hypothetical protein CK565_05820 [Campylobacter lari]|nr:hypothetical protein [Campylobacter lari]EAK5578141.1 hypothetical protein [Campylobacter lari]